MAFQFRSKFAETIFHQKYAHEGAEDWPTLASTLVQDVCRRWMPKEDKDQLTKYIIDMKFIPGGRYLYYAGRDVKAFNNCLSGDTKVLTDIGWVSLALNESNTINVLSPVDGAYYPATIYCHGDQPINEITFAPYRGRSKIRWTVRATPNHHWPLVGGADTYNLQIGDRVPANTFDCGHDDLGFVHGLVFGDGNRNGQLRLCGKKVSLLEAIRPLANSVTYPDCADGDPMLYFNQKVDWKNLPPAWSSSAYIASFIRGWIAADGCTTGDIFLLNSVNRDNLLWFREHAAYAGFVINGALRYQDRDVSLGNKTYKDHRIYTQNFRPGRHFNGFKVVDIRPIGVQKVYCPFEPVHGRIVIDHNIDTFNCFLLKSADDSREDWANLSWKAESCLSYGGGIGNDYSIYRPRGSKLRRTGGVASGPISKMKMINEIGREVMQGGSRRSAIYASLRVDHPDIHEFLTVKDWHSMLVPGTSTTFAEAKASDFNFPCPLDMTNISINYGTHWLLEFRATGDVGEVFRLNVAQAMKTGEPGFSFNFFAKEHETARNACTEVTSEDDSDVCNLGSVNFAAIESMDELRDVVRLASQFLLCGTLVADLPYPKVHEIREKNRRLGLGIMGLHEWLIQRGYRYEVNHDLRRWLAIYAAESADGAIELANRLGISVPIAFRAIAPTGSIGIMAGTTTGIEPIFAVAYKRRYLTNGTQWKYQYVVDSAAQSLIERYGVDPDSIESALDLAVDYERRIKFQADIQDYVDMSISSTINLPSWGTEANNESKIDHFALTLAKYAHRLRGFTCYPDGSRGGQPLVRVPYSEAKDKLGQEFEEGVEIHDVCDISGKGGFCGS